MINERAKRQKEKKEKEKEAEDIASLYKAVFLSPSGQKVLKHLEKFCGFGEDPFNPESQRSTDYMLGRSSVSLHINKILEKDNGYGSNISPHISPPTDSNS